MNPEPVKGERGASLSQRQISRNRGKPGKTGENRGASDSSISSKCDRFGGFFCENRDFFENFRFLSPFCTSLLEVSGALRKKTAGLLKPARSGETRRNPAGFPDAVQEGTQPGTGQFGRKIEVF